MTDVMDLARRQRARLADEVAKLDAFLCTARALAETGCGVSEAREAQADTQADDLSLLAEMLRQNGEACTALIGRMIRHRRWMMGITVEELARLAGLEPGMVEEYERGARRIDAGVLRGIAAAMKVPVSFFLREPGGGEMPEARLVDGMTTEG